MSLPLENITVKEIMSLVVYSTSPDNTVAEAYGLLRGKRVGGLTVLENGKLVGFVTHFDFKKVAFEKRQKTKIREIMSTHLITASPDEKASDAMQKMTINRIIRMAVVSNSGGLVGFLALSDIERAVKTLRNRKLNIPQSIKCPNCNAPLPLTISRTLTCQHCGHISSV